MQTNIVIVCGSILNISTVHSNGIWHLMWCYLSKPVLGGHPVLSRHYSIPWGCPLNTGFTVIQNLYWNYNTGVLHLFYSMTQSTTRLWTETLFSTLGQLEQLINLDSRWSSILKLLWWKIWIITQDPITFWESSIKSQTSLDFLRTQSDSGDFSVSHLGREGKEDFGWVRSMKGIQGRRDASPHPLWMVLHLPLHFWQARPWPAECMFKIQSGDYKIHVEQAWIKVRYSNDMHLTHM